MVPWLSCDCVCHVTASVMCAGLFRPATQTVSACTVLPEGIPIAFSCSAARALEELTCGRVFLAYTGDSPARQPLQGPRSRAGERYWEGRPPQGKGCSYAQGHYGLRQACMVVKRC